MAAYKVSALSRENCILISSASLYLGLCGASDDTSTLNCCIIESSRVSNRLYRKDKYQKTGDSAKINSTSFTETECPRRM